MMEASNMNGSERLQESDVEKYEQVRQRPVAKIRAIVDEWGLLVNTTKDGAR